MDHLLLLYFLLYFYTVPRVDRNMPNIRSNK